MNTYLIPTTELELEVIVILYGTNDQRWEAKPDEIAKETVRFGLSVKAAKNEVAISGIVPRKHQYCKQAKITNESLKKICLSKDTPFTDRGNITESTYINYGGLHLTARGSKIVGKNNSKCYKEVRHFWLKLGMSIFDRSKVSLKEKNKNFILDKHEFKLANSSKSLC